MYLSISTCRSCEDGIALLQSRFDEKWIFNVLFFQNGVKSIRFEQFGHLQNLNYGPSICKA